MAGEQCYQGLVMGRLYAGEEREAPKSQVTRKIDALRVAMARAMIYFQDGPER